MLVISNYRSGLDDKGTSEDITRLEEMLSEQGGKKPHCNFINNEMAKLKRPFFQIPTTNIKFGNNIQIDGFQLGLKSLQGVSAYITSNIVLHETGPDETTYNLNEVNISFNKDEALHVDSLVLKLLDNESKIIFSQKLPNYSYDELAQSYHVDAMENVDLYRVFKDGDALSFRYMIYATANDENGQTILPLVFSAERDYKITEDSLISPAYAKKMFIIKFMLYILLFITAVAIAYFVYRHRGKKRRGQITNFTISPLSHDRFMEVKDKRAINYDCWYWRQGMSHVNIPVKGQFELEDKAFAKKYPCHIEFYIDDIDTNEDFSFRPDPQYKDAHGNDRVKREWYKAEQISDDGTFSFNVNAYLEPRCTPDFNRENILKMKVIVRCVMNVGNQTLYTDKKEEIYTFIVQPSIDDSDIWVAFDPGTTGSCVAYGAKSLPTDTDDIALAENPYETLDNEKGKTHIFPSMIKLDRNSERIFSAPKINAESLTEGEDFLFGNSALMLWDGNNCFQSIKKMLGYADPYAIYGNRGTEREIEGKDLAHLLAKGLYNHVEEYILTDPSVKPALRSRFVKEETFRPQRAIVAVPNNYTMAKVQDMVDTIKRTNKFKEVHFIYEAEAVMMMYFRKNWENLATLENHTFMVYDMGGATINTSLFNVRVTTGHKGNNTYIEKIDVNTIAKVGYGIGGDDIDYALIQIIYDIPSIKNSVTIDKEQHQKENKAALIEIVRELKLHLIDKANGIERPGSLVTDATTFFSRILIKLKEEGVIDYVPANATEEDEDYIKSFINIDGLKGNKYLEDYVYSNIVDAVSNLLGNLPQGHKIELIASGRSILFPGVMESIDEAMGAQRHHYTRWDGFDEQGTDHYSAEAVKTAVATGACWYAMYSENIVLHNKIVTSDFGFIDMIDGKQTFIPVLRRGQSFDHMGSITCTVATRSPLPYVKVVQMLCEPKADEYERVLENKIFHKYNILDEVPTQIVRTSAEKVELTLDEMGVLTYAVKCTGGHTITIADNRDSRLGCEQVKTEIVNENTSAYVFATISIKRPTSTTMQGNSGGSRKGKRKGGPRF